MYKLSDNEKEKVFSEMIEKIFFNKHELEVLKKLITDVSTGQVQPKKLKLAIIESRVKMIKRISHIFPFYYKQVSNQREIDKFTYAGNNSQLIEELEEKNRFLEELGRRLHTIKLSMEGKFSK
jgi:hypothetical protein